MRQFRISGKSIRESGALGVLALTVGGAMVQRVRADSWPAAQAQEQLTALIQDTITTDKFRVRADSPSRDIVLACIASVFLEWQSSYLSILESTVINYRSITDTLNDYGVFYEKQKSGLRIEDEVRRGMAGVIRDEISSRRALQKWPPGPDVATLWLSDARLDVLNRNYEACSDPGFVLAVEQHVPPARIEGVDLDPFLPPVAWVRSPRGGLKLIDGKEAVAAGGGITVEPGGCGAPGRGGGASVSCAAIPPPGSVLSPVRLSDLGFPPVGRGRAPYEQFLNNLQGLGI